MSVYDKQLVGTIKKPQYFEFEVNIGMSMILINSLFQIFIVMIYILQTRKTFS